MSGTKDDSLRERLEQGGLSRRAFLKGGGFLLGTAALAGTGLGLGGCAPGTESDSSSTGAAGIEYDVYDADVLVIGTGFAGMSAAFQASSMGATVVMVDKGPFQFSGGTGMNWDQEVPWLDFPYPDYTVTIWNDQLANQKLVKNVLDFTGNTPEALDMRMWWVRNGGTTWSRNEDGTWENLMAAGTGMNMIQGGFSRHIQDTLKSSDISVVDQTMITDLLVTSAGECVGAVGMHVPTGRYRIFRASATVTNTGGNCQMYGWMRTHPISMNTPDNTGDIDAAAYRRGCSLINSEFFGVDLISVSPASLGCSFNSGIGADGNHMKYVCDKDGNFFMRDFVGYDISRPIREAILAGKGGEHGGVFIDLTSDESVERHALRPVYARNIQLWKDQLGIDVRAAGVKVPVVLEAFEHGQGPTLDENAMTQVPGLFSTRSYGQVKGHIVQGWVVAAYAAKKAVEYSSSAQVDAVDWQAAADEISRLEEIRTRAVEGGLSPAKVRHAIQEAFYAAFEPGTDADRLNTCIAELERIKTEDLPNMLVSNKTRVFNVDWKQAIENYNLITTAEAAARSALLREESRDTHYRVDFPEQDDANWRVNIAAKSVEGIMTLEKLPVVTI